MNELRAQLDDWLKLANELNKTGASTRSRELSLAITKVEEARHWLLATEEGPY